MLEAARPSRRTVFLVASLLGMAAGQARADRIALRGGGQIHGKIIPDKDHPGRVFLLGETGRTPLSYAREQIVQVTPEAGPLDEYVVLREKARPDAESEYNLGVWAEEHKLADLASVHYEAAVKLDGEFAPARQKLGHVLNKEGRWLDADAIKEAQGMVKFRGRWVTPEEKDRKEAQAAATAEGATWSNRIKLLRDAYIAGPDARSREAERRLLAIREPVAVAPVLRLMGDHPLSPIRALAARILGPIPGPAAASGLVGLLLAEFDETVRVATMTEIARRDADEVVPPLVKGLRSTQAEVVNRAAWGLSKLDAVAMVPRLVPALITIEYRMMMVPVGDLNGGGGGGGSNMNFSSASSSFDAVGYSNRAIPVQTQAVVGPGVAAIGVSSVPFGAYTSNSGINLGGGGGGGGGGSRTPIPRLVPIEHRNAEVLAALVKMTGRDFGFDILTWKQWISTSFKVDTQPVRRVPQP